MSGEHLFRNIVRRNVPLAFYIPLAPLYRIWARIFCWYVGLSDQRRQTGTVPLPPAPLRYRVHGSPYADSFLKTGKQNMEDMDAALMQVDRDLDSFQTVLDFGCGCGRTLRWFVERGQSWELYGTDIDSQAISWCRDNLAQASFEVNKPTSPLEYPDDKFDFILAISVFTHLNQDHQFRWLAEFSRILKPNGILLLTVRGYQTWQDLPQKEVAIIEEAGFHFRITHVRQGTFPGWYQDSYHSKEYVLREYSKYFDVLNYASQGLDPGGDYQDIVICRKA